jgi:hypothetical protein
MTVYYVSADGESDVMDGSLNSPFKTIQSASNVAQPGDTILVQPGIYRERVAPPRGGTSAQPIVYRAQGPNTIIRGSIPWYPKQKYNNSIYWDTLDPALFTDKRHVDGPNPFRVPFSVTPYGRNGAPEFVNGDKTADRNMVYTLGQVFVNDIMYVQCPYITEMKPNTWFYDMSTNRLYVYLEQNIDNCQIEITNQRRLFAPHTRQLRYIVVDGFVMERCGNNYPNKFWNVQQNQQAGLLGTRSGRYWTIQNNTIRYATGVGIDWGNEGGAAQDIETGANGQASGSSGHVIQNNIICDNGAAGTASFMGKNFLFANNVVERNNNLLFYGKQRWESAGIKIHTPTNSTIIGNMVRNNYCNGIWADQGAGQNSIFKNNVITNNKGNGINFEIGTNTTGKVLNNIFDANDYNVAFATSGGCLIAHNLFLSARKGDIYTYSFNRPDKWDSLNVEIYYNLFMTSPIYMQLTAPDALSSRVMNYNQYASDISGRFIFVKDSKTMVAKSPASWAETWGSDEGSLVVAGATGEIKVDTVSLNITPQKFPAVSRPDITDDFFGQRWATDVCVAGPFGNLVDGFSARIIR